MRCNGQVFSFSPITRCALALLLVLSLGACSSQTRLAVNSLDDKHPGRSTDVCEQATQLANLHDDITLTRTLGTPMVVLAAGAPALLPVWLLNMGLDAIDRLDASHVNVACGYGETPLQNIAERVFIGGGFNLFTKGIKWGN